MLHNYEFQFVASFFLHCYVEDEEHCMSQGKWFSLLSMQMSWTPTNPCKHVLLSSGDLKMSHYHEWRLNVDWMTIECPWICKQLSLVCTTQEPRELQGYCRSQCVQPKTQLESSVAVTLTITFPIMQLTFPIMQLKPSTFYQMMTRSMYSRCKEEMKMC